MIQVCSLSFHYQHHIVAVFFVIFCQAQIYFWKLYIYTHIHKQNYLNIGYKVKI